MKKKNGERKTRTNQFNLKEWVQKNKDILILAFISILCLIIGSFAIGFLPTFVVVAIIDIIAFLILFSKRKGKKQGKTKKKGKHTVLKWILLIIFILGIIGLLSGFAFLFWIASNVEAFDPDKLYSSQTTVVYDNKGVIIDKLGVEKREIITYDQLPEVLINAVIATEDSRFFQHNGFDLPRFLKASFGQLTGNSDAGGASTLTMQLSKNNFTSTKDEGLAGIIRKFSDIYISIFQIEKNYTKQEILEFYMNDAYLGAGASGVEQACLNYFGKHAKDINLTEAALIAGLFNSPSRLDPFVNPEGATKRRSTVLYLMELHGYITSEERQIADSIPVESLLVQKQENKKYNSFIEVVAKEVQEKLGVDPYTVPMEIYTTMDTAKQEYIEKIMSGEIYNWKDSAAQAGIAVIDTKTGAVIAIGGGRNKVGAKTYNYAIDITRQIGSTAKPLYDYGPAIEFLNWDTYHPFVDEPWHYTNGPDVNNWDGTYMGFMTMRNALANSRNIPALKTFQQVTQNANGTNEKIKQFVTALGLHPELENGKVHEAHAIGGYAGESPLTMAGAYAAFGNKGVYNEPYSFTKIIFRDTGETYENKPKTEKVMGEDTAYMVTNMLLSTTGIAIGNYGNINNATIAAKTGTTNYPSQIFDAYPTLPNGTINDEWVIGYDPAYTIAVWYGYDHLTQEYVDNGYYTKIPDDNHARIFNIAGRGIFTDSERFTKPNNVKEVAIELYSYPTKLPSEFTPKNMILTEYFKEGTEPTEVSTRYAKLDDPKNVASEIEGTTLTLTWDAIDTPSVFDEKEIEKYVNGLYFDEDTRKAQVEQELNANKKTFGEIQYLVYLKKEDGTLDLIATTENTTIDYTISSTAKPLTFVVKAAYTNFKDNMSSGAELTVELDGVAAIITASLLGDEVMQIPIGNAFTDPGVFITDNLIDVTKQATITTEIKDSKGNIVESINVDNIETYTITYTVSYSDFKKVLVRTVKVLENSEPPTDTPSDTPSDTPTDTPTEDTEENS